MIRTEMWFFGKTNPDNRTILCYQYNDILAVSAILQILKILLLAMFAERKSIETLDMLSTTIFDFKI